MALNKTNPAMAGLVLFYLSSEATSAAAKLLSALPVTISAFQLIQSIFIRLKWEFRYLFATFRTFPIPTKHLAGSIIVLCHWFLFFFDLYSDKQWHIFRYIPCSRMIQ